MCYKSPCNVAQFNWKSWFEPTHNFHESVMHTTLWDKLKIYKSFLKSCWIKNEVGGQQYAASHPLESFLSVIINNCDSTKAEKLQIRINTD